jgi:hypothetical protein
MEQAISETPFFVRVLTIVFNNNLSRTLFELYFGRARFELWYGFFVVSVCLGAIRLTQNRVWLSSSESVHTHHSWSCNVFFFNFSILLEFINHFSVFYLYLKQWRFGSWFYFRLQVTDDRTKPYILERPGRASHLRKDRNPCPRMTPSGSTRV